MARAAPAPPRLRRRRRGLARGRDRHRRLAARRALRPPRRADRGLGFRWRLEGLGPRRRHVRPSRRAHGVLRASRAVRRPSRCRRPLDPPRARRGLRRGVRRACGRRPERRRSAPADTLSTRSSAASELGLAARATSWPGSPRSGSGTPGSRCSSTTASSTALDTVGDGKHLRFRVRQRGRDAGSAIAFGFGAQLDRYRRDRPLRRRVPAAGEPLERHGLAAARRPPHLRHRRALRGAARLVRRGVEARGGGLDARGARGIRRARARPQRGRPWRSLLESEAFRRLLDEEPPLAQAA